MWRVFFFLLGFGLMVVGCSYIITYLNLLTMGYSFSNYLHFIFGRVECLFSIIGFIMISVIILTSGRQNDDLYL
ncbi:MAG: hypothetical protein PUB18_04620 [bacterium]|nr:hypothetical protein [bacterium]